MLNNRTTTHGEKTWKSNAYVVICDCSLWTQNGSHTTKPIVLRFVTIADHYMKCILEIRKCLIDLAHIYIYIFFNCIKIRCKITNKCVKELVDLLIYSRFTPTCFGKWLSSSGGRRCLRSYSNNIYKIWIIKCARYN
jgi:hypothetical protein